MPECFLAADTALFELGGLAAGMSVLVHGGASGVGTACIQLAKHAGATVVCTVGSAAKAEKALALGADVAIDHRTEDFVHEMLAASGGLGADLVVDIVGADYLARNLAALRDGGCLVQLGVMSGTTCELDLDELILRRLQLKGSVMRPLPLAAKRQLASRFRAQWLPLIFDGRVQPVVDSVFRVADVAEAHRRMERSDHFGKIVLDVENAGDVVASHNRKRLPERKGPTMTKLSGERIERSFVDVSEYDVKFDGPDVVQVGDLPERVAGLLEQGYCVCYGTNRVLSRQGLDVFADRAQAYELLESIFRSALALIDTGRFSITPRQMTVARMDLDGYNLNESFTHDGQIAARAFMSTRCLHFDAATPFIGNIYGPNRNIQDGKPIICDIREFCLDRGVAPASIVESIPNNYNIAIGPEFYDDLLREYSFALDVDLDSDVIIVMLLNEITYGVAHGATDPLKAVADEPASRPMRHIEMQYLEEDHYVEWYSHYQLEMLPANDYAGENLSLAYHGPLPEPFSNFVGVPDPSPGHEERE